MPQQPPRRFSPGRVVRGLLVCVGLLSAAFGDLSEARAGGSAETVFLVVNERSWSSLSIANHYIRLRDIPASNVFYLHWEDDNKRIDSETCRTKLLKPVFAEIRRRGLADLSPAFIVGADYGTRASSVVLVADDHVRFIERRLGPHGSALGETDRIIERA